ncbi:hypothetical protein B7494_g2740 [Chlorociboria aeruginascens]|nr:hypothetical protein B7494_g2740 [Chlorociboria aeruginascens]
MPAGPDETDDHTAGAATEHVAKNSTSNTESNASDHPLHHEDEPHGDKVQFRQGPVLTNEMPPEEGTKEERRAQTVEINKK